RDWIGDGRLTKGRVIYGADGEAAGGEANAVVPGGAEPAVQCEVDGVAAVGEVETDEHVADRANGRDAVTADRWRLVELEVDVGRAQRVHPLPAQIHKDVVVRSHLAADVEVGQVALVIGDGAVDHGRDRGVLLGALAEGVVVLTGRQVVGDLQLGRG